MHRDVSWTDDAKCKDVDPEFFFVESDTKVKSAVKKINEAKAFCQGCPVAVQCLGYAIREDLEYGVYGGLSEDERKDLKTRYLLATRRNAA